MYLFLVGPPGVGKSTLAPVLAARLGAAVVEIDGDVERRTGRRNRATIDGEGIERFRDLESDVLADLPATPAWTVVDTGGGTPLRPANRRRMRELGLIIGLRASLDHITRGIAATLEKRQTMPFSPRERAEHALSDPDRVAGYADVDISFDVEGFATEDVASAVATWLASVRGLRIDVGDEHRYPVLIRYGLIDHLGTYVRALGWGGRVAVVTERTVEERAERARRGLERAGFDVSLVHVPAGEAAKSLDAVAELWRSLADAGVGRDGGVVAVGGGALGDAAGFAAATYMRGVPVVQVPTTLLAMVDASIGGKTAIDIAAGKNLVGAFHPPAAVLTDPGAVATLPRRARSSGLAEIVKTAFLADETAVAQIERSIRGVLRGEIGPTLTSVTLAAEVKANVVTADPKEEGLRALLNFGHTMGHALEAASGYRKTHGEAVALGMVYASALAETVGVAEAAMRPRLERMLAAAGLPRRSRIPPRAWAFVRRDKKARAGAVRWILPRAIGRFSFVSDVPETALREAARALEGA